MLKVAVCDDDPHVFSMVKDFLTKYSIQNDIDCERPLSFSTAEALLLAPFNYDVLFLDIRLERTNGIDDGIEVGMRLREQGNNARIIVLTSLPDMAIRASEMDITMYLLKPLNQEKFNRALNAAIKSYNRTVEKITVYYDHVTHIVPIKDIISIESQNHKRFIITKDTSYANALRSLNTWEELLGKYINLPCFYWINRSIMINLDHVQTLEKTGLIMVNGQQYRFPIKRRKAVYIDITNRLYNYLFNESERLLVVK